MLGSLFHVPKQSMAQSWSWFSVLYLPSRTLLAPHDKKKLSLEILCKVTFVKSDQLFPELGNFWAPLKRWLVVCHLIPVELGAAGRAHCLHRFQFLSAESGRCGGAGQRWGKRAFNSVLVELPVVAKAGLHQYGLALSSFPLAGAV